MLISDLKLLFRFNSSSIFEEVSQTSAAVLGNNINPVVSTSGYLMQDNQYLLGTGNLSNGYNLDISNAYTVGFWLFPAHPGLSSVEEGSSLSSIEMPLLHFVNNDNISGTSTVMEITEHTQESGNNSLRVVENSGYSAFSEEYVPDKWHYFWISHSQTSLRIFIDGVEHTLQNERGSYSGKLYGDDPSGSGIFSDLYINHSIGGYSTTIAKNTGIIDDLFVFNIPNTDELDIQRSINDGIEYVVDDNFTISNIDKFSIYFNDPETINITSLIDDLSYVFVGRNDGKILRGSPLLWETRRSFSNPDEYEEFNLSSNVSDDMTSGLRDGFLQLINTTIRL